MPPWLTILTVLIGAGLFIWYISPEKICTPSKIQSVVAKTWIILRRIISFSGACFGIFIIYVIWTSSESIGYKLLSSLAVTAMSTFFIYVGIVGQGWVRHSFNDDLSLYKKVKEKYGIRW